MVSITSFSFCLKVKKNTTVLKRVLQSTMVLIKLDKFACERKILAIIKKRMNPWVYIFKGCLGKLIF